MGVSQPPSLVVPKKRGSLTGRAAILVIVAGVLVVTLAVPVRAWFAQRAEISGLQADVDAARERVASLTIQKERWQDPAFVAAEARRRLHFVLPGEIGYTTLGADGKPALEVAAAAIAVSKMSWYERLWTGAQEADDAADQASISLTPPVSAPTDTTPTDTSPGGGASAPSSGGPADPSIAP